MDSDRRVDAFPAVLAIARRRLRAHLFITVAVTVTLLALAGVRSTDARAVAASRDDYDNGDQDGLVDETPVGGTAADGSYDPHARDFTDRCLKLAKYSSEKACEVFMDCCSEDYVLNKLNGDRCQRPDVHNGCTLKETGGVMWSLCRAFNCTAEVTTTTTTTTLTPDRSTATAVRSPMAVGILITIGLMALITLQYAGFR